MKLDSALILLIALLVPAVARGQDLTGSYTFQHPQGLVSLDLQQSSQGQLVGRLSGADGSTLQLEGMVQQDGRATGRVASGGGVGWFAAGFTGTTLVLVVAEVDPTTGQPDLNQGWSLEFTRAGAAAEASGGGAPPGAVAAAPQASAAAGAPEPFGPADESQLAREWREMLRGAKLTRISSYSSSTPGGGGFSEHWEAYLCSDQTFYFRDNSVTSMGDLGAYSARQGGAAGRWQVVTQGNRAYLASQFEGQQVQYGELTYDRSQRATSLDGKRFYITRENTRCR